MNNFEPSVIIAIYFLVVLALIGGMLFFCQLIGNFGRRYDKEQPFECGLLSSADSNERHFSISYYLIAAAFLIFELEAAILLLWGVNYWRLGIHGVITASTFIIILMLGLVYMLGKGALDRGAYQS